MNQLCRYLLITLMSVALGSPIWAEEEDWNTRERESLEKVIYPEASVYPEFPQIKNTFEKALANDSSVVPELSSLMNHSNEYVAMAAGRALGRFPNPDLAKLLKQTFATEGRSLVRAGALAGLGRMRDPATEDLAKEALSDPSSTVQAAGVGVLEELGNSANSLVLLAFLDRNPDETIVLDTIGKLGDPPGSTAVRDRLVTEMQKKQNGIETRMEAAFALRSMGREDLARPIFDWSRSKGTFQSLGVFERAIDALAAKRNLTIKSQSDVDLLLKDALAADHNFAYHYEKDEWGRPIRVRFIHEGQIRAISDGPDNQPDTPDDISRDETSSAYVKRIFPDLF